MTITLHDKAHEPPYVLPDVFGKVDHCWDSITVYLPKFWNDIPGPWQVRTEPEAMAKVNEWIDYMNREFGYTVKCTKL